jgi:flotillin
MVEKIDQLVASQVEAIQNLKIDKITVWDSGGSHGSTTANFLSGMVQSIPPLQDLSSMVGLELPEFLGKMVEEKAAKTVEAPAPIVDEESPVEEVPPAEA